MGFHRSNSINSVTPLHPSFSSMTFDTEHSFNENNKRFKNHLLYKMIWGFGNFVCFSPPRRKKECITAGDDDDDDDDSGESETENNLEPNKEWLLAESGGCGSGVLQNAEPQSVHSSFRFSFCSQVELENIKARTSSSPATVLMVNLENGMMDSPARELKWKRMVSIQKSISPLTKSLTRFTYGEIVSASSNFSKGKVLGRGALSYVFRGRIGLLRTAVAIKRLDKEDKDSSNAFCRELMIASSLNNPHIVPLVGFCIEPDQGFFLVYQYVSGGNLEHYLHEKKRGVKKGGTALPWSIRYKVAVGIAEAIGYLHNGTDRCILHRDIKPSNILLSSKKLAKLCDFGLATWTPAPSVPFLCKTVKGTFGYLAPEYFQHGKVSDKTDVYAFGVVLLELITGRRPIEMKRGPREENLVEWAKPLLQQHCTEKLLHPRIKINRKNANQISRTFEAATACIKSEESQRPNAEEVIALLRGGDKLSSNCLSSITKATTCEKSYVSERYAQLQPTKTEMESHIALAMLGVSEFEDDEHVYVR